MGGNISKALRSYCHHIQKVHVPRLRPNPQVAGARRPFELEYIDVDHVVVLHMHHIAEAALDHQRMSGPWERASARVRASELLVLS